MLRRYKLVAVSGQSLIEVVVSIALAAILAISLISTTLITQKTSQSAKNTSEATKLAQEGIELMRVFRDRQGFDVLVNGSCYSLDYSSPPDINSLQLYTSSCPDGELIQPASKTSFYRKYVIEDGGSVNSKLVTVIVNWDEPGGQKTVTHETIFSNWDQF